jgi:hypothetical protein
LGQVVGLAPFGQAVTRGRRDIKLSHPGTLEWATAVLYLRSPSTQIFDPTAHFATPKEPA